MDDIEFRFELVKLDMSELQQSIRNYDSLLVQVKGWAVTVGLASTGFSVTSHKPAVAVLGVFATLTFWAIDSARRATQDRMIARAGNIERLFENGAVDDAMSDPRSRPRTVRSLVGVDRVEWIGGVLQSGRRVGTWALYLALGVIQVVVAAIVT
ncbi:hypothetical protein [Nocardioides sp. NPDC127503]|uniref:hypothetical protein n=1 Tax=Nocardioides sp. NPDC127503 TaxID=3154516 RepID=UPI00331C731B